jgi:hypothetical protein
VPATFLTYVDRTVKDCGTIFGAFDSAHSQAESLCQQELERPTERAGLLLIGALVLMVSSLVTLVFTYGEDPLPFGMSLTFVGLPVGVISLIAFVVVYSTTFSGD